MDSIIEDAIDESESSDERDGRETPAGERVLSVSYEV